jgi:hypothetical protein
VALELITPESSVGFTCSLQQAKAKSLVLVSQRQSDLCYLEHLISPRVCPREQERFHDLDASCVNHPADIDTDSFAIANASEPITQGRSLFLRGSLRIVQLVDFVQYK